MVPSKKAAPPPVVPALTPRQKTIRDATLLTLLCLVFFVPFLLSNRTVLPIDWHGTMRSGPYGYPEARQPHAYSLDPDGAIGSDIAWAKYIADSMRQGEIPFWNPYQGLGQPLLAEGGSQVLYLPNLLNLILPVEHWDVQRYLHLLLMAWFVYLFARECGIGRRYAVFAGAGVYAGGFSQGYLGLSVMTVTATWLPLIFVGIERAVRTNSVRRVLLPVTAGTYFLGTGGHPGLLLIGGIAAGTYLLVRCAMERAFAPMMKLAIPTLIGFLCAAPALLPFVENVTAGKALLQGHPQQFLAWKQLPAIVFPHVYGAVYDPGVFGNPRVTAGVRPYAWLPPGLLFFAIAGACTAAAARSRRMILLAGIALWFLLWMMNVPPFNALTWLPVTMLKRITVVYAMGLVQLCACVLAAYGLCRLDRLGLRAWVVASVVWIALIVPLLGIVYFVYTETGGVVDPYSLRAGVVPAVSWAIAVPAVLLLSRRILREPWAMRLISMTAMIASGIAFLPSGAPYVHVFWYRMFALAGFVGISFCVVVIARVQLFRSERMAYGFAIAALFVVAWLDVSRVPGWPVRYNPFTVPSFVGHLQSTGGAWRSYGLEGYLFPNLSSGYRIPTLNVLDNLIVHTTAPLSMELDPCQPPLQFYGITQTVRCADASPLRAIFQNRRLWDYIGVRYLIGIPSSADMIRVTGGTPPASEPGMQREFQPAPLRVVSFPVRIEEPAAGITVLLSTYGIKTPGSLSFTLTDSAGRSVVSEVRDTLPLDGATHVFFPASLSAGDYTARAQFTPSAQYSLGIWHHKQQPELHFYAAVRPVQNIRPWFRDRGTGVLIWENASAQPPVYVAPRTVQVTDWREGQSRFKQQTDLRAIAYSEGGVCSGESAAGSAASRLLDMKIEPNRVWAKIAAATPGTVVVTSAFMPGWSARIDGSPASVYRVNGAFQGACLSSAGTHEVIFEYEPPVWRASLIVCATGVLLFTVAVLGSRRLLHGRH